MNSNFSTVSAPAGLFTVGSSSDRYSEGHWLAGSVDSNASGATLDSVFVHSGHTARPLRSASPPSGVAPHDLLVDQIRTRRDFLVAFSELTAPQRVSGDALRRLAHTTATLQPDLSQEARRMLLDWADAPQNAAWRESVADGLRSSCALLNSDALNQCERYLPTPGHPLRAGMLQSVIGALSQARQPQQAARQVAAAIDLEPDGGSRVRLNYQLRTEMDLVARMQSIADSCGQAPAGASIRAWFNAAMEAVSTLPERCQARPFERLAQALAALGEDQPNDARKWVAICLKELPDSASALAARLAICRPTQFPDDDFACWRHTLGSEAGMCASHSRIFLRELARHADTRFGGDDPAAKALAWDVLKAAARHGEEFQMSLGHG